MHDDLNHASKEFMTRGFDENVEVLGKVISTLSGLPQELDNMFKHSELKNEHDLWRRQRALVITIRKIILELSEVEDFFQSLEMLRNIDEQLAYAEWKDSVRNSDNEDEIPF